MAVMGAMLATFTCIAQSEIQANIPGTISHEQSTDFERCDIPPNPYKELWATEALVCLPAAHF